MTSPDLTDSPEDFIRRAREVVRSGHVMLDEHTKDAVPAAALSLLSDLARTLEGERRGRASSYEMVRQANMASGSYELTVKHLRRTLYWVSVTSTVLLAIAWGFLLAHR